MEKCKNVFTTTIDASTLAVEIAREVPVGLKEGTILVDFVVLENATFECLLRRPFLKKRQARACWKSNFYSFVFDEVCFTLPGVFGEEEEIESCVVDFKDSINKLSSLYSSLFVDSADKCI
jgi:hypothetical protein